MGADAPGALVTLSGGQDSTTCLFYAQQRYRHVEAVSFDYGQRHAVELECAARIAKLARVRQHRLSVDTLGQLAGGALTNPDIAVEGQATLEGGNTVAADRGLPSTFVPGRNAILLSVAAALAVQRDLSVVVTGVCEMDRAGYPDCRAAFVLALEAALRLGLDTPELSFDAPLLVRTKADTWELAAQVGALDIVRRETHTCYEGDHRTEHSWGYGCGRCPACEVRAEGWDEYVRRSAERQGGQGI